MRASFVRWSLLTVPAILLLGFLSSAIVGDIGESAWFAALQKPAIYPPPAIFGIVWAILWVLIGFAVALVCAARGARLRNPAIALFVVQFFVSLAWTPLFFALHEMSAALVLIIVLDLLVLATIYLFWNVRPLAAALMLPYLAWLLFATILNYQFLALNPDADGAGGVPPAEVQRMEL